MLICIASYPRSGNTMFRMALNHLYGIKTHSIYTDHGIVEMHADTIVGHQHGRVDLEECAKSDKTYFVKTHALPPTLSIPFKAIHIVRDGRDVLTSYAHYMVDIDGTVDTPKKAVGLLLGSSAAKWNGWSGHARAWIDWPGDRVLVKYEDMVKDVHTTVQSAMNVLNLPFKPIHDAVMPKFNMLNRKWPSFFRSGIVGTWFDLMTSAHIQSFWNRHLSMMRELNYV